MENQNINNNEMEVDVTVSSKKKWPAFFLAWFLGGFGAHRFYVGKTGTAIAQLLTVGGCGIWTLIDIIMILMGKFTDKDGKPLA